MTRYRFLSLAAGVRLAAWILPLAIPTGGLHAQTEPGAWRHYAMHEVDVNLDIFRPLRARYVQIMYDLAGREEVQSRGVVHLDLERAVHSGAWDGSTPVVLSPLSEPGLVVTWQVQNVLYSGFDRVLTDEHLSLWHRVMPGRAGLIVGSMEGDAHTRIEAAPAAAGAAIPVDRTDLPEGSVNILTIPYVLAAMRLAAGDRFTLPGYAMIGGPESKGTSYTATFRVVRVGRVDVKGRSIPMSEVLLMRLDSQNGRTLADAEAPGVGQRITRLLVSPEPPYLLGRTSLVLREDGTWAFAREFLGLVDWADQALTLDEYADRELWDLDLDAGVLSLKPEAVPAVIVPLRRD